MAINKPTVSIIIPVYNTEKYLRHCFDSVLAQTYKDFECILVDDGSTDASSKICDEYASKDIRFKVFHKGNEGISATREFGVQHANGQYIQFVDSDDWIESDMLAKMYEKAVNENADIVGCNFIEEFSNKKVKYRTYYKDKESFLRDVIASKWGVLWKIMFKRSLFIDNNIHFPKGINGGEDYYVVTSLLLSCNKAICVDDYLYHYFRDNPSSFITTPSLEKVMFQVHATEMVEKILKNKDLLQTYHTELCLRKAADKSSVMNINIKKGCKIFPEINIGFIKNGAYRKKFRLAVLIYSILHPFRRSY